MGLERPKLVRDWENGFVKTNREIRTGAGSMPANTVYKITGSGVTAHLESLRCECCGRDFRFTIRGKNKFADFEWLGRIDPQGV